MFFEIAGFILGLAAGVAIALCLVASWVKKSNDYGDSTGEFKDFSPTPVEIIYKEDNINY